MTRDQLLASAKNIRPATIPAVDEYAAKRDPLVAEINKRMLNRPDIHGLVGEDNIEMMKDNHCNHARFVESMLRTFDPEMLVETVLWVFRAYRSRGFHYNYWAAQINAWIEVLKSELSPESYTSIYPLYEWFSVNIPIFSKLSDEQLTLTPPQH